MIDAEIGTVNRGPAAVLSFASKLVGVNMTRKPNVNSEDFAWSILGVSKFCDWRDNHFSVELEWALTPDDLDDVDHDQLNHLVVWLLHGKANTKGKKAALEQNSLTTCCIVIGVIPVWAGTIENIISKWPHLMDVLLDETTCKKDGSEFKTALQNYTFSVSRIPEWDDH